jgi:hypothetical protein
MELELHVSHLKNKKNRVWKFQKNSEQNMLI